MTVQPGKRAPGIEGPTPVVAFDFMLATADNVNGDIVYEVVKAIHGNKKKLMAAFGPLALFDPQKMSKQFAEVPHHPAAIKFYKEAGLWKDKM